MLFYCKKHWAFDDSIVYEKLCLEKVRYVYYKVELYRI